MQTLSVGKTHTVGLVISSRPGKWTLTSAVNISCLSDSHKLHRILPTRGWTAKRRTWDVRKRCRVSARVCPLTEEERGSERLIRWWSRGGLFRGGDRVGRISHDRCGARPLKLSAKKRPMRAIKFEGRNAVGTDHDVASLSGTPTLARHTLCWQHD